MSYGNEAEMPTQEQLDREYQELLKAEQEQYYKQKPKTMNTGTFTSKITRVVEIKGDGVQWRGVYYHLLEMDNGDKINIGKKKHLTEGEQLSYEVLEVGQQEYAKAKSWNPDYNNDSPKPNYTAKKSSPSNNASFALSYAKDIFVAHGGETPENTPKAIADHVTGIADEFLKWLNENS